jgi:hypothetical protein
MSSLLGTAACACYFAASTLPDQQGGLSPSPFLMLGAIIGAVMLPACLVLPVVLLPTGGRYPRKAAPAARWWRRDYCSAYGNARKILGGPHRHIAGRQ